MAILGFAFDLEGTVIDVETAHHHGHLATAAELGVMLTLDEALQKLPHFIGGPDEAICEEIWRFSDQTTSLATIIERDKFHYHRLLKELPIVPRPGFLECSAHLDRLGIKKSIGSLTGTIEANTLLERSGLSKIFDRSVTVLREDVQNIKPAPDVFLETARRMGIQPNQQLVFEDSSRGVQAARAAGSLAIGMPVYHRPEVIASLKTAGALHIFMDWHEISEEKILSFLDHP